MDYYSALKRNELSSHEKTERRVKCILLSERSQCEKPTYYMIPTKRPYGKAKSMKPTKKINGYLGLGGRYSIVRKTACLSTLLLKDI